MPDISPNGSANVQPNPEPGAPPRIAPPVGTRAARGEVTDEVTGEVGGNETAPAAPEIDEEEATSVAAAAEIAEAAPVEDSYEPPFDYSIYDDGDAGSPDAAQSQAQSVAAKVAREDTPKDMELGLLEHLGELRKRLLYCAIILLAGMSLTWSYSQPLQKWFSEPIVRTLGNKGILISTNPTGFFSITVQFSLVSALIITAPLLFWQIWLFIEPALTKTERRYSLAVVPFSSALFFLGAGLSYLVSPLFFNFFLSFQPASVAANWDYMESIMLMAKMLLAFGVMFQVPVVVIFLNKLGLLPRNVLIEYWRHAVVIIFVVAAIVTPTWDPVTLAVCATPPCLLYILSIWLVKWL